MRLPTSPPPLTTPSSILAFALRPRTQFSTPFFVDLGGFLLFCTEVHYFGCVLAVRGLFVLYART